MKKIIEENNTLLLRFDKGEEVIKDLTDFCQYQGVKAGSFQGLGAAGELVLSYYDLEKKVYQDTFITENVEIVSMIGNLATMDEKIIIHAHGVFGKKDLATIGGHIKKLVISATCELTLVTYQKKLIRCFDQETGLNLLS